MPDRYGKWESIATRFYRWQKAGIWKQILEHLQAMPAAGYAYADQLFAEILIHECSMGRTQY
ncbi:Transposase [Nostoc flagelliforme CCNUN1]|uniref:Transposase n=2 Tax=Nostoc flagelliforme TaxID=1306274 RepID=A0A2K8SIG4_9NOSO|nr:Transposase [Nostoc flagelliforme CCNUN1]